MKKKTETSEEFTEASIESILSQLTPKDEAAKARAEARKRREEATAEAKAAFLANKEKIAKLTEFKPEPKLKLDLELKSNTEPELELETEVLISGENFSHTVFKTSEGVFYAVSSRAINLGYTPPKGTIKATEAEKQDFYLKMINRTLPPITNENREEVAEKLEFLGVNSQIIKALTGLDKE